MHISVQHSDSKTAVRYSRNAVEKYECRLLTWLAAGDAWLRDVQVQRLRLRDDDQLRGRSSRHRRAARLPARLQDPPGLLQEVQAAVPGRGQRRQLGGRRPVESRERGTRGRHRQPLRHTPASQHPTCLLWVTPPFRTSAVRSMFSCICVAFVYRLTCSLT